MKVAVREDGFEGNAALLPIEMVFRRIVELGYDGVLINSAIALAEDPVRMGEAFASAVVAGRIGYEAGVMQQRETASPSTPVVGTPFWHTDE